MMINVLDYLISSAEKHPEKTAVIEEERTVTYSELFRFSCAVGSSLLKYNPFGKPVGVFMEKGIDALCSFFGIVSAGGFYCMLNPELPEARLLQTKEVLQPETVITSRELKEKAEKLFSDSHVCMIDELIHHEIDTGALNSIRSRMIDTDPLYVNFTSGSTGIPKGIVVAHRSVIDFIGCFTEIFQISEDDIIANQAPFDFDVSVKDIYSAIRTGATLVIVPRRLFSAPTALLDYLCGNRVTTMIWAVSALCLISTFHGLDYKTPDTVNKVLFSGEVMPYKHLKQWQEHLPDAQFVNLYGPTEITCNCTYHILEKGRDYSHGIPIGKPFPNEDVFLTDGENRKITVPDTTGKITVRGTALALGYYRLAEKNDTYFIQNPLNADYPERVYVTGDLGRYDEQGDLFFCGRTDNQIKYLGHRIELEEIERNMAAIEGVEQCFCVFDKGKLKGYYVGSMDRNELYSTMQNTLPAFMIPGFLRRLDEMPITKNGKTDRARAVLIAEGSRE